MKNLILTEDYSSMGKCEEIRVSYENSTDLVWIDVPSKYEFVDLGLPSGTLWATCNVGANSPEEIGLYFQWGDTQGYKITELGEIEGSNGIEIIKMKPNFKLFDSLYEDYKWYDCGVANNASSCGLTKYNFLDESYGIVDNLSILELIDDAAYQSDNICRTPSKEDFQELIDNTTISFETLNNINGWNIISKINNNSIFIPISGHIDGGTIWDKNNMAVLHTNSLYNTNPYYIEYFCIYINDNEPFFWYKARSEGMPIRPVKYK